MCQQLSFASKTVWIAFIGYASFCRNAYLSVIVAFTVELDETPVVFAREVSLCKCCELSGYSCNSLLFSSAVLMVWFLKVQFPMYYLLKYKYTNSYVNQVLKYLHLSSSTDTLSTLITQIIGCNIWHCWCILYLYWANIPSIAIYHSLYQN